MTRRLIVFSLLILGLQLKGQETGDKPLRIEYRAKTDDESHRVIPVGQSGVVIFYLTTGKESDSTARWFFAFYDQNLKQKWSKNVAVPDGLICLGNRLIDGKPVIVFAPDASGKNETGKFAILKLDPLKPEFEVLKADFPSKSEAVAFDITRDLVLIGYNSKNGNSGVLVYNIPNKSLSDCKISGEISQVTEVLADTANGKIFCSLRKSLARNKYEFFLDEFDLTGKILSETVISAENNNDVNERNILSVNVYPLNGSGFITYGSYRSGSIKQAEKGTVAVPATGVYLMEFRNGQKVFSKFVNFLEFRNLTIAGKNGSAAMKKKESKRKGDETEYSIDYSVSFHPAVVAENEIILLAELFTPQFHMEDITSFDFYGRPYTYSYKVFDGYHFSNGILMSFSRSGNLLWDNEMEIVNLVSYDLLPKIDLTLTDSSQLMCYLAQGKIGYKIVSHSQVLENLDFAPLDMPSQSDKLLAETRQRMERWYGNFFLCYGYQEIKNINSSEDKKRLVFYVTKVQFN